MNTNCKRLKHQRSRLTFANLPKSALRAIVSHFDFRYVFCPQTLVCNRMLEIALTKREKTSRCVTWDLVIDLGDLTSRLEEDLRLLSKYKKLGRSITNVRFFNFNNVRMLEMRIKTFTNLEFLDVEMNHEIDNGPWYIMEGNRMSDGAVCLKNIESVLTAIMEYKNLQEVTLTCTSVDPERHARISKNITFRRKGKGCFQKLMGLKAIQFRSEGQIKRYTRDKILLKDGTIVLKDCNY